MDFLDELKAEAHRHDVAVEKIENLHTGLANVMRDQTNDVFYNSMYWSQLAYDLSQAFEDLIPIRSQYVRQNELDTALDTIHALAETLMNDEENTYFDDWEDDLNYVCDTLNKVCKLDPVAYYKRVFLLSMAVEHNGADNNGRPYTTNHLAAIHIIWNTETQIFYKELGYRMARFFRENIKPSDSEYIVFQMREIDEDRTIIHKDAEWGLFYDLNARVSFRTDTPLTYIDVGYCDTNILSEIAQECIREGWKAGYVVKV